MKNIIYYRYILPIFIITNNHVYFFTNNIEEDKIKDIRKNIEELEKLGISKDEILKRYNYNK